LIPISHCPHVFLYLYLSLSPTPHFLFFFFFFNDTATTEIYTVSLHDALPIFECRPLGHAARYRRCCGIALVCHRPHRRHRGGDRSEEHTSELQSRGHLVCRLLLEKKK